MPQLNPEFFISQLFWLVITFTFLFIFLWKYSLPRISSVLEKRKNKINDDINAAKQLQAEAEEIQKNIDDQLYKAKSESADIIKKATFKLQDHTSKELQKFDEELNKKLEKSSLMIEQNKLKSLEQIDDQIYDITKLTFSKIANISTTDNEVKEVVDRIKQKVVN